MFSVVHDCTCGQTTSCVEEANVLVVSQARAIAILEMDQAFQPDVDFDLGSVINEDAR